MCCAILIFHNLTLSCYVLRIILFLLFPSSSPYFSSPHLFSLRSPPSIYAAPFSSTDPLLSRFMFAFISFSFFSHSFLFSSSLQSPPHSFSSSHFLLLLHLAAFLSPIPPFFSLLPPLEQSRHFFILTVHDLGVSSRGEPLPVGGPSISPAATGGKAGSRRSSPSGVVSPGPEI